MLEMMLPGLPKDAMVSVDGIVKFGARGIDDARRCAYEALRADSGSRIARQLLSLLLVKSEVRCVPGTGPGTSSPGSPNVAAIVSQEVETQL
jgi:hypothetical protein